MIMNASVTTVPSNTNINNTTNDNDKEEEINDIGGWNVVTFWKKENFKMNEHQTTYLTNMFASEILPGVYVGSKMAANDKAWLSDHKITHILTVAENIQPTYPESYHYKLISIRDFATENILIHFEKAFKFINQALAHPKGAILIHW
nr:935_t:CDS:2 [Entrophospora candida]